MSIGTRIKAARQAAGLSQEQLARLLGIAKGSIGNYEADISHPKEEILIPLMTTLHVDANYIYQDYIPIKKAPAQNAGDALKDQLLHNYDQLNALGREKLVDYSDDLTGNEKYTQVIPAAQKEA